MDTDKLDLQSKLHGPLTSQNRVKFAWTVIVEEHGPYPSVNKCKKTTCTSFFVAWKDSFNLAYQLSELYFVILQASNKEQLSTFTNRYQIIQFT